MKEVFLWMSGKWAKPSIWEKKRKRQQQNEIFSQISMRMLSVCVKEEEKKAIGKEISNSIQANRF